MAAPDQIAPTEARAATAGSGAALLLDCREPGELGLARIDGAVHVPMGEMPARCGELDRGRRIIVFCHHGVRSRRVAGYLAAQGFRATSMTGGIDLWSRTVDASVPRY